MSALLESLSIMAKQQVDLCRLFRLADLIPGAVAPDHVLDSSMLVEAMDALRDTTLFIQGNGNDACIDTQGGPVVQRVPAGQPQGSVRLSNRNDTGNFILSKRKPDNAASLLDLRWFADVSWSVPGPERTPVGLQCTNQDQQAALPASDIFATYDALEAIMVRSGFGADVKPEAAADEQGDEHIAREPTSPSLWRKQPGTPVNPKPPQAAIMGAARSRAASRHLGVIGLAQRPVIATPTLHLATG
ncbi:hypothetical protein WJX74_010905 [Apatococcus lobatus]|uniref:Uncharacterized protein n=1 Tax=Apatococcus lobatus TaxID=904363 RepID=A0AAW1QB76_9CHLO